MQKHKDMQTICSPHASAFIANHDCGENELSRNHSVSLSVTIIFLQWVMQMTHDVDIVGPFPVLDMWMVTLARSNMIHVTNMTYDC